MVLSAITKPHPPQLGFDHHLYQYVLAHARVILLVRHSLTLETHRVLECPNTLASRQRICQALRVALPLKEAGIRFITNSISDRDLILASLGAPIPLLPPHKPLYAVFINAAAKAWADEAVSLGVCLKVSA